MCAPRQLNEQGLQFSGNPTGTGDTHLFIKPNLSLLPYAAGAAAAPLAAQPNNVQVSLGDGKSTATEQLQVMCHCTRFCPTPMLTD